MERLKERLLVADKALSSLLKLVQIECPNDIERDATMQRFEYSFEAVWKAVNKYLDLIEGIQANSPKAVIRASLETGLLDERSSRYALLMADDRNLISHTYHEELAKEIAGRIPQHAAILSAWLRSCQQHRGLL